MQSPDVVERIPEVADRPEGVGEGVMPPVASVRKPGQHRRESLGPETMETHRDIDSVRSGTVS